jgi:hypothetical protein
MNVQDFKFFLIHRSGYRALGASRKIGNGYLMFRIHHPSANVYDALGTRKPYECVGGIASDDIQQMIESGEWDIASDSPYEQVEAEEAVF